MSSTADVPDADPNRQARMEALGRSEANGKPTLSLPRPRRSQIEPIDSLTW
jgi:hypothetical protein